MLNFMNNDLALLQIPYLQPTSDAVLAHGTTAHNDIYMGLKLDLINFARCLQCLLIYGNLTSMTLLGICAMDDTWMCS